MIEEDRLEEAATPAVEEVETEETEQVETAETEETTEETEESGNSEDGEDAPAKPKKRKSAQERIAELTGNWRQTERERDYWREIAQKAHESTTVEPDVGPKPKMADFDYDETRYEKAVDEWHAKRFKAQQDSVHKRQQEFEQVTTQAQKAAETAAFMERASEQYEDFAQVVSPHVPISDAAADVILTSKNGAAVAYYLGKNIDEARRIHGLPAHLQAYEIAQIERRISPPPKPQQTTGAPPPPKKVKPSGGVQKHPDEMTTKEWLEWRNKQLSK